MEHDLLLQSIADIRSDIRVMEERLGKRIDAIQPQCQAHADRLGMLERSVTAMDSQRKTILGMVAFAASMIGAVIASLSRYILGQ